MLPIVLAGLALLLATPVSAEEVELAPMSVWPSGVPPIKGWPGLAKVPVQEELRDNGEQVWNVTVPTTDFDYRKLYFKTRRFTIAAQEPPHSFVAGGHLRRSGGLFPGAQGCRTEQFSLTSTATARTRCNSGWLFRPPIRRTTSCTTIFV